MLFCSTTAGYMPQLGLKRRSRHVIHVASILSIAEMWTCTFPLARFLTRTAQSSAHVITILYLCINHNSKWCLLAAVREELQLGILPGITGK
jgi:hypothetical protein